MKKFIARFLRDDEGQDLVEYALLVAAIALIVAAAVPPIGEAINQIFSNVNDCLQPGGCPAS